MDGSIAILFDKANSHVLLLGFIPITSSSISKISSSSSSKFRSLDLADPHHLHHVEQKQGYSSSSSTVPIGFI
ncbi:hypothetical protein CIPAW_04G136400 [Carya illinoinensis]|uniref:Uncharacterized protein n=1 Tax=Carya illinoinensis TaxID=32201 RepID=A0A8T1QVA9_CARIL|nr:hypothetical protein CIPAW_04G136400 [Carya illinoinensis]